jgi:hypothetical protein
MTSLAGCEALGVVGDGAIKIAFLPIQVAPLLEAVEGYAERSRWRPMRPFHSTEAATLAILTGHPY